MSLGSAISRGRAAAELRMRDACTARRQTGTAYDDDTGTTVPTWSALYDGRCRMSQPNARASRTTAGEADVLLQTPQLHLPMAADMLRPGDEVTITESLDDPQSVGRVFIVRDVPAHSHATARRYGVTERTS